MNQALNLLITILVFGFIFPASAVAQSDEGGDSLVQRIQALSRKAKTVDTGSGYSDIIVECDDLLTEELKKDSHREYLTTLLAWALDMRAVSRIDLADQFRDVNSLEQANQIHTKGLEDFARSIENDPNRWQTPMHRAEVFIELKDYAAAVEDYSRVIAVKHGHTAAWFNRAELRSHLGQYQDALADYTEVLRQDASDMQAESGRADCHFGLKQYQDAVAGYSRVIEQLPKDGWALANRADAWLAMKEWENAQQDLAKAVSMGSNGEFCRRLSWLLSTCPDESICNGNQALELAKRAIDITGESANNLDALAAAYAATGEFDRARDVYARVVALTETEDPDSQVKQAAYEKNERYQESFDR